MTRRERKLRVVKLGGSLLDLDDLADRLRRWLAQERDASNVLVVGGGRAADLVRERDRKRGLSDSEAHWLAISAMEVNARKLAAMLGDARWLDRMDEVRNFVEPLGILNPMSFMLHDDPCHPLGPLPASWDVTSDSIAARAADMAGAADLVLLKSAHPPMNAMREQLAAKGYVDAFFPTASGRLSRVQYVNLRDNTFSSDVR